MNSVGLSSSRARLLGALAAMLAVVWGFAFIEIDRGHEFLDESARRTALWEARTFAHNLTSNIARVDELLLDLREEWLAGRANLAEKVDRRLPHIADMALQVAVIDRDGYLTFTNLHQQPERIYLGEREHVRVHLEGHGDHLFISKPVLGKVSQRWSIQFSRPILDQDRIVGVMVISVAPDDLAHFNSDLTLGDVSNSTITTSDGVILARQPAPPGVLGQKLTGPPYSDPQGASSGVLRKRAQTDGIERLYGWMRIPQYDLIVSVGHGMAEIRALEGQQRQVILGMATGASVVMLLVFWLLWRWETDRDAVQERLQSSRAMLRSSIDTIGEAFAIYDRDDRLAYFNEQYRRLYARSAPVIEPGRSFEEIIRYGVAHGQYVQAMGREEAWISDRLASHHRPHTDEIQQLDDGTWLRVRERKTPEGFVVGFRTDITELVKARLASEEARQQAESGSRAKTEFLANVSHELRTPLNGIIGMSEVLSRSQLDVRQREMLGYLNTCSERLRALLADLLDFAALESGTLGLQVSAFHPDTLVEEVVREAQPRAAAKGLQLSHEIQGELPPVVHGDPHRLRQVLAQLLDNAVKFTEQGSVELHAFLAGPGSRDSLRLGFRVRDTGIGISAEDRHLIFQPFTQKDGSSSRRHGGTGLGLSLASGIVSQMGGVISVDSVEGYGSTFTFTVDVRA